MALSSTTDVIATSSSFDNDVTTDVYYTTTPYWDDNVTGNVTTTADPSYDRLVLAYDILVACNSAFITLAMGAGVEPKDVLPHIKKPYGPLIGILCQCILMPALCFAYAVAVNLDSQIAVGMILTGSCPGGALSNIFTYWSNGNLTLSVSMTVFSTTLAVGFLPLNMFIYTLYYREEDEEAQLPYANLVFSMAYTWVAAFIGVIIAWKAKKAAKYVARIGSILGIVFIMALGIMQSQIYSNLFDVATEAWAGALSMPIVGFLLGFTISSMFCLPLDKKKAIAYETGTQNVAVALSVIAISFDNDTVRAISPVPMLYAFSQIVVGLISSLIHQLVYRSRDKRFPFNKCGRQRQDEEEEDVGNENLGFDPPEVNGSAVRMDPDPPDGSDLVGTSTSPPLATSVLAAAAAADSGVVRARISQVEEGVSHM